MTFSTLRFTTYPVQQGWGVELQSISRFQHFQGTVQLPGSKSIANRAVLMAALCEGVTRISNLPAAEDVERLLIVLPELGIQLESLPAERERSQSRILNNAAEIRTALDQRYDILIHGSGGPFTVNKASINVENAGTAMRPLVAVLASGQGRFMIDGNEQMRRRPIADLVSGLQSLGVEIKASETGCPPVEINARGLGPGRVELSGRVSSQYISAMLLAAPLARATTSKTGGTGMLELVLPEEPVSKPYIDLTLSMLDDFGIQFERDGYRAFRIPVGQSYRSPGHYHVEGDASAASYFLGAGGLPGCGPVRIQGLGKNSRQGDIGFAELMREMGARVEVHADYIEVQGPPADQKLKALDKDMNAMPDAAMTLATLALFSTGTTHIRNIENLRVKESERIRGLRLELEKLGARVVEEQDALHITAPDELRAARISTYKDHRMAMAFALAAFGTDIEIEDPGCVEKTYRHFFRDFLPMTGRNAPA